MQGSQSVRCSLWKYAGLSGSPSTHVSSGQSSSRHLSCQHPVWQRQQVGDPGTCWPAYLLKPENSGLVTDPASKYRGWMIKQDTWYLPLASAHTCLFLLPHEYAQHTHREKTHTCIILLLTHPVYFCFLKKQLFHKSNHSSFACQVHHPFH